MDTQELKYWIAFNQIPRIGRVRFGLMEQHFGSLSEAWRAGMSDLLDAGIDDKTARLIVTRRPNIDPDNEIRRVSDWGASAITRHHDEYPPRPKEIYDPPPVLYVNGEILPGNER